MQFAPAVAAHQAVQQPQQGRLARAVGTDQRQALATLQCQRHAAQRLHVAEAHRRIVQAEQRSAALCAFTCALTLDGQRLSRRRSPLRR